MESEALAAVLVAFEGELVAEDEFTIECSRSVKLLAEAVPCAEVALGAAEPVMATCATISMLARTISKSLANAVERDEDQKQLFPSGKLKVYGECADECCEVSR